MLNLVKMLNCTNAIIHNTTGYSFSLSNIPKNISKVAFPAIALIGGTYVLAKADNTYRDPVECCSYVSCEYENCVIDCVEGAFQAYQNFFYELGKCLRICVKNFP
ncbi:hypothetical protein [Candidatus Rhabdochlamydia porcellionis]|jgi:hypothetical protein|uniref:Uncharacterized protein n=1 Tax=Candidatus Rhabdochlamydia porcellionis TaxID=225148 RepID=A0ABX8YZX4_9BACT|nr:hypothetical protein [Candidatus Rhabdochlamydia porcellionis]QZA58964.1 hypothetical protein RHAB15C_0000847 [Candidatus Rhabdochlamydia porcellionis]